jgi:hypothetical protein
LGILRFAVPNAPVQPIDFGDDRRLRRQPVRVVLLQGLGGAAPGVGSIRLEAKRERQWGIRASSSRGNNSLPR